MKTKKKYWSHKQSINSLWLSTLITYDEKLEIERRLEKDYSDIKKQ